MRWKGRYKELRRKYPNVPQYVFDDLYTAGTDEHLLYKGFNRLQWKLQVIEVNISDFQPDVQANIIARKFGEANPYEVPNDIERVARQKQLTASLGKGENEPIIVVKRVDGYDLYEGWHRTMALLLLGKNDGAPKTWDKVRIKAWVGSSKKRPAVKEGADCVGQTFGYESDLEYRVGDIIG